MFALFLKRYYEKIILIVLCIILLFFLIGLMTTFKTAHKWSASFFSTWSIHLDSSVFLEMYKLENHSFSLPMENTKETTFGKTLVHLVTSVQLNDIKSLIFQEIPGLSLYERNIVVQSEKLDTYQFLSHESGPPLEIILQEREAKEEKETEEKEQAPGPKVKTVLLYNSHNRESFLPHLEDEVIPNNAYHDEVNITKISERLKQELENKQIGVHVEDTDIMGVLHEKGWKFSQSYQASREVVAAALEKNDMIEYMIDIHRDSLPRDKTTKTIQEEKYATILFVVGREHKDYEKNLSLATALHKEIDTQYPGLSRGVITKEGPSNNGIYNQDLSENALLIEVGGYENTLEEMYRTTDVFAEIFSQFYFDVKKVNK